MTLNCQAGCIVLIRCPEKLCYSWVQNLASIQAVVAIRSASIPIRVHVN